MVLGYKRMSDRYSNIVSTLLRSNMLASQRSALLALASAAGRQQFREAALVYAVLLANEVCWWWCVCQISHQVTNVVVVVNEMPV